MKKAFAILLSVFFSSLLLAQAKKQSNDPNKLSSPVWAKAIPAEDLIKWRRHIHENAELSFKEENTSMYVESILKGLGNLEILKPAKTSVIGILRGSKPGKTIAFRADMDGLPVQEETGLNFASKNENIS